MELFRRRSPDPAALIALLAEADEQAARGPDAGRRHYRRVVEDGERLLPTHGAEVAPILGHALVVLGRLAGASGRRAEELDAYRRAAGLVALPADLRRELGRDAARRGVRTPEDLRDLVAYFTILDLDPGDWVSAFAERLCCPGTAASPQQQATAADLAARIVAVAPGVEWAQFGLGQALTALGGDPGVALTALTAAERLRPDRVATANLLGRTYLRLGREDHAYLAFRRTLARDVRQPDALVAVADIEIGRAVREADPAASPALDRAISDLRATRDLLPQWPEAHHRLARALRLRSPREACEPLRVAASLDPGNVGYRVELAGLLVELGETRAAIGPLLEARALAPQDAAIALELGRLLIDARRPAEAEASLAALLERDPRHRAARYELGRCLLAQERPGAAAGVLAGLPDRTSGESHLLGRALVQSGDPGAAERELAPHLHGATTDHRLALLLGCVRARGQAWPQAAAAFARARDVAAQQRRAVPDLDLFAGVAAHRGGDLDGARHLLAAARDADPDDPRPHVALGALELDAGDPAAARGAYEAALQVDPDGPDAVFGLAVAFEELGQRAAAVAGYRRGLLLRPGWRPARLRLAAVALAGGDPAEALRVLDDAAPEPDGTHLGAHLDGTERRLRAGALTLLGDVAGAHALWADLHADGDAGVTADLLRSTDELARTALERGDPGVARELWERCAVLDPDGPYSAAIAAALAEACLRAARAGLPGDHLDRAAQLLPDDPRVRLLAGVAALRDGRADDAVTLLAPASGSPAVDHQLAVALAVSGDLDGAARRAGDLPDRPAHRLLRGTVEAAAGRWSEAFGEFRAALPALTGPGAEQLHDVAAAAVCRSAHAMGDPAAGVSVLRRTSTSAAVHRLLAVLLAGLDQLDEAEQHLRAAGDGTGGLLVRLQLRRAMRLLDEGADVAVLAGVLDAVDRLDPGLGMRGIAAELDVTGGGREAASGAALEAAELRLDASPTDAAVLHRVAVLARRALADGATPGSLAAAWGALLHSSAFWRWTADRTGRDPADSDRDAARDAVVTELSRLLRERAAGTAQQPDVDLGLELRTAAAIAQVPGEHLPAGWPDGFACGPALLPRLGELGGELRRALASAPTDTARRAAALLSPLGRAVHLRDSGRLADAVRALDGIDSAAARELRAEVLTRWGVECAEAEDWADAVDAFLRAAADGADIGAHATLLQLAATRSMRTRIADGDDYAAVVEMLEAARRHLPRDEAYDANLAASYVELAKRSNNRKDYEAALRQVERAVELAPTVPAVRRSASVVTSNFAITLLDDGSEASWTRAFTLFDRSLGYDDSGEASGEIHLHLRSKAAELLAGGAAAPAALLAEQALRFGDSPDAREILAYARLRAS